MSNRDRRVFPRHRVCLQLHARLNNGLTDPTSRGQVEMTVETLSLGGLSALVGRPVLRGSRLAVSFPPVADCRGNLAGGKVLECRPERGSYRIRVEFDRFPGSRGRLPDAFPARMLQYV